MNTKLSPPWYLSTWFILPILAVLLAGCKVLSTDVAVSDIPRSSLTLTPPDTPTITLTKIQIPTPLPAERKTPVPDHLLFSTPSPTPTPVSLIQWAEWKLDMIYNAAWSPDSQSIALIGGDQQGLEYNTYLYNINTLQLIWQTNEATSNCIVFSPDGKIIVGCDLQSWNALTGQAISPLYGGNAIRFPVFLPDGTLLIGQTWYHSVGDSQTDFAIWDSDQRRLTNIIEQPGHLKELVVSSDGKLLAALLGNILDSKGIKQSEAHVWDLVTKDQRCAFQLIDGVAFDPTGNILALIDNSETTIDDRTIEKGEIHLYDTNTCQYLKTLYKAKYIKDFAYSPDGQIVAFVSDPEYTIRLLNATTGELLYEQRGEWDDISQLAFSPDGKFLMSREAYYGREGYYEYEDRIHIWKVPPLPLLSAAGRHGHIDGGVEGAFPQGARQLPAGCVCEARQRDVGHADHDPGDG
jgi:WD40 repeat protein